MEQINEARFRFAAILITPFFLAFSAGCGYHLLGKGKGELEGARSIAIPYFTNKTYQPGLDRVFTEALLNEFIESRRFSITTPDQADVVMKGTLKSLEEQTISYDRNDRVLEYRLIVKMDFSAEERLTGKIIWRDTNITDNKVYQVDQADIAVTEFGKDEAIRRLAAELAERIHDNLIQGF
jgi:outer membrane lipopolysaccharide assembly protein LptE/RlpB